MKLSRKQIKAFIALAAIVTIAALIYYNRNKPKQTDAYTIRAINADDQATFLKMVQLFADNADPSALYWLLPDMATHQDMMAPDYLVNGRVTKTGAFLRTWAQEYYAYGYVFTDRPTPLVFSGGGRTPSTVERNLNTQLYGLFYDFQARNATA